ncbi:MAG: cupin domain-containing protein [Gammaproteobacteria bacterium]
MTINTPLVTTAETVEANAVPGADQTDIQVLIGNERAPHFAMRRFTMQPGGGMPNHTNTVEHEQYVLAGSAHIGIGDEEFDVKAGDVVFIPAGTPHWYTAGDEGFQFLCLVPNQEDKVEIVGSC